MWNYYFIRTPKIDIIKVKKDVCIHRAKEIQASASRRTHTHANTGTKT